MKFPNKEYIEQLRKNYPIGTKIQLISMRDEKYPVLTGTVGEVTHIDDMGTIHMKWENGSSEPSTTNLIAIGKLYEIPPEELLKKLV